MSPLADDLTAMVGVWHDHLVAFDRHGGEISDDPHGGVAGAFPYDNLVYVDFDGYTYTQTNVTFRGRPTHARTFGADVADGVLRFGSLGPEAPRHIGVSGGSGLIWFVPDELSEPGLQRYAEPDLIRLEGDRRWRTTVLFRQAQLVRMMLVEGTRLTTDTTRLHPLDPRPADTGVHGERSTTTQYLSERR